MRALRLAAFAAACTVLASRASAQTIAPAGYLPLGADPQWLLERVEGSGPSKLRLDVVDVTRADTGIRCSLEVPIEEISNELRLEIANDGQLLLRALTVDLTKVVEDLSFDPDARRTADSGSAPTSSASRGATRSSST